MAYTNYPIPVPNRYPDSIIKQYLQNRQLIKVTKLFKLYSLEKTKLWLEEMEQQGYNLVQTSQMGLTFYFTKGRPRKMCYHLDHQHQPPQEYYTANINSGWSLFLASHDGTGSFTIWGKEYTDSPPPLLSDPMSRLIRVKKLLGAQFVPVFIYFFLFLANLSLSFLIQDALRYLFLLISIIYLSNSLIRFWQYSRTRSYYSKLKKQIS